MWKNKTSKNEETNQYDASNMSENEIISNFSANEERVFIKAKEYNARGKSKKEKHLLMYLQM